MLFLPKKNKPRKKITPGLNQANSAKASDLLGQFELYLTDTKGLRPASIKNYLSDLRSFFRWQNTSQAPQNKNRFRRVLPFFKTKKRLPRAALPSSVALQSYKDYLLSQKRAKSSINRRLASLRVFCQFCYDLGLSEQNPAQGLTNLSQSRSQEKKINDLVSRFGAHLKKEGASRNTIKNYTADVRRYLISVQDYQ